MLGSTLNGIPYEEFKGSPTFAGGRDGPTAQRKILVAWSNVDSFLGAIFPAAIATGRGWIFPVSAAFPGRNYLCAQQYKVEPFDPDKTTGYDSNGVRNYEYGVITLEYKFPEYDTQNRDPDQQGNQIIADYSQAYSAEMLKLGVSGWVWEGPDVSGFHQGDPIKNEEASLAKAVVQVEHTLNWKYVPYPPFRAIARACGCVNSDTVLFYAAKETLLFTGAEIKRSYYSLGDNQSWQVTYKFLQRCIWGLDNSAAASGGGSTLVPIGWNHFYRNEVSKWDKPKAGDTNGEYVYEGARFADLFYGDTSQDTE